MNNASIAILVVDDSPEILDVVELALEDHYTVLCTGDPQEALRLLDHHKVELLLSDVVMPAMSGIELVARVLAKAPTIKVVMMTGYSALPIDYPVLYKPFRLEALMQKLKTVLTPPDPTSA